MSFGVYVIIWQVSCDVTVSSRLSSLKSMPSIYNWIYFIKTILDTSQCQPHSCYIVWFQLRAVLQVKAALTAILYPAEHFLPDYLIISKSKSAKHHTAALVLSMDKTWVSQFFRPRLQEQFLSGDFLYCFLPSHIEWSGYLHEKRKCGHQTYIYISQNLQKGGWWYMWCILYM